MPIVNTIPSKIPKTLLREMNRNKYDNLILLVLGVFGPHKKKELVNDPKNSIEDRMNENIFQKWITELKDRELVEKNELNGELTYNITELGEEELLKIIENKTLLRRLKDRLQSDYEEIIGSSAKGVNPDSKSVSGYTLSYKDFVFGLLSVAWRVGDWFEAGKKVGELKPENNMSFGNLIDYNSKHFKDRPALFYEDILYTYEELNNWINRYANYFLSIGLKKGDIINVFLENRPELMIMVGAMSKIGTIASLINTNQRAASLIHSLKINKVKGYVIGEELYQRFHNVMSELDIKSNDQLFYLADKGEIILPEGFIDLKVKVKDQPTTTPSAIEDIKGMDPYAYIFTSGTTGLPKAAPMRHIHFMSSTYGWGVLALNMQPEDVIYITLPLFHSNAMHIGWASALRGGSAVALARKFSATNFWNDVRKYKATCFNYIGELCRYLLNQPPTSEDRNHNIYKICGNGLRPEIWKEFKERFGIRGVYEHFGATEIRGMFCNYFNRDCTIGINFDPYVLAKYDIDADKPVQDENGIFQKVEEGESGLLLMKINDPTTFAGYTDKKATEKKIFNNPFGNGEIWLNTGDLIRDIGYFHAQFVDRLGDTFRWKGENVSTSEVEDLICSFDHIEHSSVYGVEIPGTEGRAGMVSIISSKTCADFNLKGFLSVLQSNLPQYAIPKYVRFLCELSTTSTFKIRKSVMKQEGFDIQKISDPIYILLPNSEEYLPLTEEIYEKIKKKEYRF